MSPGIVLGRYRLQQLLGEGGMGEVWRAGDAETGAPVALKLIKRGLESADVRRRFLREARAAAAVPHPNVRRIHDVFELDGGQLVMIMELCVGESLKQRLRREGAIEVRELARLMQPVVSAVGKAHELGIVHRDLTPANIFVPTNEGGAVKVLDFGIAKLMTAEPHQTSLVSGDGSMLGTPAYMPPEQVFGERSIDHRADVWSLGIILYEALSGVLPTAGESVGQTLRKVMDPIAPLSEVAPHVPTPVADLVGAMLAREPSARVADLREVEAALARYAIPSFGAPARRAATSDAPSALDARDPEGVTTLAPDAQVSVPPRPPRRLPRVVVVAGILGVGAVAGFWQSKRIASTPIPAAAVSAAPIGETSAAPPAPIVGTTSASAVPTESAPPVKPRTPDASASAAPHVQRQKPRREGPRSPAPASDTTSDALDRTFLDDGRGAR